MLMPFMEHLLSLSIPHSFPYQQLFPLHAAVDPIEHRPEHNEHPQQTQLGDGVVVNDARHEDA